MSLPSRERGLKFENENISFDDLQSLPSRERGLKSPQLEHIRPTAKVAPLAGAWIEILYFLQRYCVFFVAPLAGAWIEIYCYPSSFHTLPRRSPRGSVD